MQSKEERTGELMLIGACVLEGLFPIVANRAADIFPPLFFLGFCSLSAGLLFVLHSLLTGKWSTKIRHKDILNILGIVVFIFSAFVLIMIGTKHTSGINTALLLKAEIFFTFIFATLVLHERLSRIQFVGMIVILAGGLLIAFNGTLSINFGDMLIILGTALFPFGNTYAKKAMKSLPINIVLMLRYLIGGTVLMILSLLLEDIHLIRNVELYSAAWILITYIVPILIFSKILIYGGFKRIPLGRAIYIVSSAPAFSLIFAFFILKEYPTLYQAGGFVLTVLGVYLLMAKNKVVSYSS